MKPDNINTLLEKYYAGETSLEEEKQLKNALKSMDAKHAAELNTPAGLSFRATCTQCHALPDPKQHTAKEWPLVVARMQKNIITMGKTPLDETATKEIVEFLRRYAKKRE